ncbi:MAG: VOC family protein [Planctomycetota bacterium]|jgi:glyoxylase I family protein|nr:VOC family protein [Planctomycetota bacterium]
MSQITGIDHPAIAVADVDAYADWCCSVLGFERVFRHDKPVWILRSADGTLIEIMPQDDTARPDRTTWTPGWSHLAMRVADFDAAVTELSAHGVQWTGEEVAAIGGGRVRSFADPEHNMWQIVAR